jgi:hypothetical protein
MCLSVVDHVRLSKIKAMKLVFAVYPLITHH